MSWEDHIDEGIAALEDECLTEAREAFSKAARVAEEFGEFDPRLEVALSALARVYDRQGDFASAEPVLHPPR